MFGFEGAERECAGKKKELSLRERDRNDPRLYGMISYDNIGNA